MQNTDGAGEVAIPLKPFAVPIAKARELLADKAISEIYVLAGRGQLELLKDGHKTVVTLASIEHYMRSLPPAQIKPYARKKAAA